MDIQTFLRALPQLEQAHSLADVKRFCRAQADALGFEHFIYAMRVPTGFREARMVVANGYPTDWIGRYMDQGYAEHDPILRHCVRSVLPLAWHRLEPSTGMAERIRKEAIEFGLCTGICIPVHSPSGELGLLSFARSQSDQQSRVEAEAAIPVLQVMAPHVHEAVRRTTEEVNGKVPPNLTRRECECLRWIADGKTSWEIARLLQTSERTINFHLGNAMAKLDVSNRQHAVAKAVLQGVLNPHPF